VRFLRQTLGWLDGVYDFLGSKVRTDDVDLSSIQLVHDVGPNSEYSSGRLRKLGGLHPAITGNNYLGGSTVALVATATSVGPNYAVGLNTFTLDPLDAILEAYPAFSIALHDLWLIGCWAAVSTVVLNHAMGVQLKIRGSEQGRMPPIRLWQSFEDSTVVTGGLRYPGNVGVATSTLDDGPFHHTQGAIRLDLEANVAGDRDRLWWNFDADNTNGDFSGYWLVYISQRGSLPPGRVWIP